MVIYTFWNIWKKRNRRIFNNTSETVLQVAARILDDIEQRKSSRSGIAFEGVSVRFNVV